MAQFYLLSIVTNILAGLALAGDYLGERIPFLSSWKNIRERRGWLIGIGVSAAVVGVIKLIIPSPGETVPVAGDLLPALFGMGQGAALLADAFRKRVATSERLENVSRAVLTYRVPLGIAGIVVALVHFFVPQVVIL
jgi:drug/metabolite transporter (DMT)-like permease